MHKFTHPNGSVLHIQRPREVADFVARDPACYPRAPAEAPGQSWGLRAVLVIFFFMAIAIAFFLVGEERPDSVVRPALTARQRAAAFR